MVCGRVTQTTIRSRSRKCYFQAIEQLADIRRHARVALWSIERDAYSLAPIHPTDAGESQTWLTHKTAFEVD